MKILQEHLWQHRQEERRRLLRPASQNICPDLSPIETLCSMSGFSHRHHIQFSKTFHYIQFRNFAATNMLTSSANNIAPIRFKFHSAISSQLRAHSAKPMRVTVIRSNLSVCPVELAYRVGLNVCLAPPSNAKLLTHSTYAGE